MTVEPLPNRNDVDRAWDGVDAIVEAYVSGRLIDSQAIRDAWNDGSIDEPALTHRHSTRRLMPVLAALLDALTENSDDIG